MIPEGLRDSAKELEDGKFSVNVVPHQKLAEFRDKNILLMKEQDTMKAVVDQVHQLFPEFNYETVGAEIGELRSISQRVKDGALVENKGLDTAIEERTREMKKSLEDQIKSNAKEAADWRTKFLNENQKFRRTQVDRAIMEVMIDEKSGIQPSARDDVLGRAYQVWHVDDNGHLTPKQGDATLYGPDGASAMSPFEWVQSLKEKSSHLFKGSGGGGANGGGNNGGAAEKRFGGMSKADFDKLSPLDKLAIANGQPMNQ